MMKYALSFLIGTVVGATIALLFAPSSGDELRANIKTQADAQYVKATAGCETPLTLAQTKPCAA